MKPRPAPGIEPRRAHDFAAELGERARAWLPSWAVADGERDFGRALLEIAARFSSEVAERLDRAGEKMQRGFLDWLAVRGRAARPARMPVVFKLADAATEAVFAPAPVRMQVDAGGANVIFETETDVRLLPGRLETVIGVDGAGDAVYLPPPGLSDLEPLEPLPTQWQLKSFAAAGATKLQVDPEAGLVEGLVVEGEGQQYRITVVDKEIITVEPPLTSELAAQTVLRKVTAFAPFDGKTRNVQEHALYLGHGELLDIDSAASISVAGAQSLREGVTWQYWGKVGDEEEAGWRPLTLAEKQDPDAVVLTKPKGAVEPRNVGRESSRWIRGMTRNLAATQQPFQPARLALRINAQGCATPNVFPPIGDTPSVAAEGMANTTPLVLESVFFPLGREPRQFDAFYLGSKEAFSKPGAQVQLHFEMADSSFESLAVLESSDVSTLAGVAGDGHLYLLTFNNATGQLTRDARGPLRPPSPDANGQPVDAPPITLDPRRPPFRAAMWQSSDVLRVAVAATDTVWVFQDGGGQHGWKSLGVVGPVADSTVPIAGIVHLSDDNGGFVFALRERKLFVCDSTASAPVWKPVATRDENDVAIELETIVPVGLESDFSIRAGNLNRGLAGVDTTGGLYAVALAGDPLEGTCTLLFDDVRKSIAPAVVLRQDDRLLAVAVDATETKLHAFLSLPGTLDQDDVVEEDLGDAFTTLGRSIDVSLNSSELTFALTLQGAQATALALWVPFVPPELPPSINLIPTNIGFAGGSPTLLQAHAIVPAVSSQVLVTSFHSANQKTFTALLGTAVIASAPADQLQVNEEVAIPTAEGYVIQAVAAAGITEGGETLYTFDVQSVDGPLFVVSPSEFAGEVDANSGDLLHLDATDSDTNADTEFLIVTTDKSTRVYQVLVFDDVNMTVQLGTPLDLTADPDVTYRIVVPNGARVRPLLALTEANNSWSASLLETTFLTFPGATPERQRGKAFVVDEAGNPVLIALAEHFVVPPPDAGEFVVDATIGDWNAQLGDPSVNPALSWEYANGTGWWKLDPIQDQTQNLKRSGNVLFTIPADLRPMDWAGRTNYWIRARLVGGDFGKEIVTIKTKTISSTETQQTIERSSSGIRAPSVVRLHIAYRLCRSARPEFVLAQDSGSIRDQSDANRTRGAVVEAFVPLAVTLGRLSSNATTTTPMECDPEWSGGLQPAGISPDPRRAEARRSTLATGRALFIGLNATPSGAPVNVLLLVETESKHDTFAPMKIEALIADRFVPIVTNDTTRALGESGLLTMSFSIAPTPRELFGQENLTWLRLTPGGTEAAEKWTPSLRGAYLNAVWASAAETLTRELLGSSQGAPNLTVHVARPPLLADSLVLRVREPLGEEERDALRQQYGEARVLSDDPSLAGDWVLWDRVIDPLDEDANARVYSLDESLGEIRFGDGQHGMIPPIGRDSIVAFTYKRTEIGGSDASDVPANAVIARSPLNLVSPVESVEAVFAAERAAGGAPPENAERVMRFGTARLRHRNRAVTARDLEDLALESSPDVVQARSFVRRDHVRLVVVMRGEQPLPDAAEVRELRRLLLASAPASLGAPDALRITGPRVRRLRIILKLRVETLDHAGEVSSAVQERIASLFDTAAWALGAEPKEEDVALALLDTRRLESLAGVELREVAGDVERPWSGAVKGDELVMLDKDPLRLEFETVEVIA